MIKKLAAVEHICVGESPLGRDSAGPWQKTGAVSEGGPAHLYRWHLQRSTSTKVENWMVLVAGLLWWGGRSNPYQLLTSNGVYHNVCSHFFTFALITTTALSWNISRLISELKLVTDNLLFIHAKPTEKPQEVYLQELRIGPCAWHSIMWYEVAKLPELECELYYRKEWVEKKGVWTMYHCKLG